MPSEPARPARDTQIFEGPEAESRLRELGLMVEELLDVIANAATVASTTTGLHPQTAQGYFLWATLVYGLRASLVPSAWTVEDDRGYPLVVHPSRQHALTAAGGDYGTGVVTLRPTTRSGKGPATRDAVDANQGSFWTIDDTWADGAPATAIWRTYILLVRIDEDGNVWSELSLPSALDPSGRVAGWSERIIIPTEQIEPFGVLHPVSGGAADDDLDVTIGRRA